MLAFPFLLVAFLPRELDWAPLPLRVEVLASLLDWTGLAVASTTGGAVVGRGVGATQPRWEGYGHMPAGWSSERQTVQLKILFVLPDLFIAVTNLVFRMMPRHSLIATWSFMGGNM